MARSDAQPPEPAKKPTLPEKLAAELLATFVITATAISVDVLYYTGEHVDDVSRWLARGFAAAVVIYAFSETSGAHADPAVTIGFALRRVFSLPMTVGYVLAQFAGGFLASFLLLALYGPALALGASHPGPHFAPIVALLCEVVLTFVLMLVILMTAQEQAAVGKHAALAVGFTVAICGFAAGPISGASMNPARTITAELAGGVAANAWVYALGPTVGAMLAVAVHALICGRPSEGERKAARGK